MRIHTKTAAALAILSALSVAMPAEARPGRYGAGAYRGGGHGGYAYSRPARVSGYGGYRSYGYVGYPVYSRYSSPAYYGSYYRHSNDTALIIGAGLLGVALATAVSARSRGDGDRRGRGYHYDTAAGYGGATYDVDRSDDVDRTYDNGRYDNGGYANGRYDGASDDADRYQNDSRDDVRSPDRVTDSDPYRYYRNGGRPDGDVDEGPVGM